MELETMETDDGADLPCLRAERRSMGAGVTDATTLNVILASK